MAFYKGERKAKYPPSGLAPLNPFKFPSTGTHEPKKHLTPSKPITNSGPAISTPYSCSELLDTLKAIQQVVRCCSCNKTLNSARSCVSGHGICWNCKNRCNKLCPLCNSVIMDAKPIMLNNIIKLLPRQCNFSEKGCDNIILPTDSDHENFCRFRHTTCRIPSCATKCMAKDLLLHLEKFHGKEVIRTASYNSILMSFNPRAEKDGLAVIVAYNNIIWQHTRVGHNKLLQFYQYVPMEKPKVKFSVVVNFYTPEDSFSSITPVHTDVFDPNQLFRDRETFSLPRKFAISFSRFYAGVNYNFKIIKEDL